MRRLARLVDDRYLALGDGRDGGRRRKAEYMRSRPAGFVVALSAVVASSLWAGPGSAGAGLPVNSVTLTASPTAPGMLRVEWTDATLDQEFELAWGLRWSEAYRITWGLTGDLTPESVVLDAQNRFRLPSPLVIPNLAPGSYTVTVDVVGISDSGPTTSYDVTNPRLIGTQTVEVVEPPRPACPQGESVCGTFVGTGTEFGGVLLSGGTSSDLFTKGRDPEPTTFHWRPTSSQWVFDNDAGLGNYTRVQLQFSDRSGVDYARWWSAFGDSGRTASRATEILIPTSPECLGFDFEVDLTKCNFDGVNLGEITMEAGTAVSGTLTEEDGTALDPEDFGNLCVFVWEQVGSSTSWERFTQRCAQRYEPAGDGQPARGGFNFEGQERGYWRIALPPGKFRFHFDESPNYFGDEGILNHNTILAAHWWKGAPGASVRAERLADATTLTVASTAITGIDGVMRPSKQLRLDVVGIPDSITLYGGRIAVVDDFDNWTGGAMEITNGSVGANVTGLVEGRKYKIFLSFDYIDNVRKQLYQRWWLVGGGTLEDAAGIVPADVIEEPWQPGALLATLHRIDGSPYGDGEACLAMASTADLAKPVASSCTDQYGIVRLQRVPVGSYRIVAYQRNPITKALIGEALVIDESFDITLDLEPAPGFFPGYVLGLSDITRLSPGSSLPDGYSTGVAVVVPGDGSTAPANTREVAP